MGGIDEHRSQQHTYHLQGLTPIMEQPHRLLGFYQLIISIEGQPVANRDRLRQH